MSLIEYKRNLSDPNWTELPTPAPENYRTTKTHLEKSSLDAKGYLHRDIVRRNRNKVFCGWKSLTGSETALIDSLYSLDYFYLRFTDNQNERKVCKVYAGQLDGANAILMDRETLAITLRTGVQMNFIEY